MLKRPATWLWTAVILLFLTGVLHALTLVIQPLPQNESERQLFELMANYRTDFGAGFKRSTKELLTALSACFSLVCFLGGLTLGFAVRQQLEGRVLKGLVGIHALVFGVCFAIMAVFTFHIPIVLTGAIFLSLLAAYVLIRRDARIAD
jgi:hypothetical protein